MKSRLFRIPKLSNHPIYAQYDYSEKFYGKFHFHEEIQLTYIKSGEGILLCGSSSIPYAPGTMVVIGSMLPHVFIGDEGLLCESISIYFKKEWLQQIYPESPYFNHFMNASDKGILIEKWRFPEMFDNTLNKSGLYRINAFLQLMEKLSENGNSRSIAPSASSLRIHKTTDSEVINAIFKFIADQLHRSISLDELAAIAHLTPPSFSRFFKQKTGKPVSIYISELRIESACRLLHHDDLNVEEIAYKVGYNNFSNFLRQFKKIKGLTPKEFRKEHYIPVKI